MKDLTTLDHRTLAHVSGGNRAQFGLGVASAALDGASAGLQQGAQSGRPILGALRGAGAAALQAVARGLGGGAG
jgi:hypothetical protein